jgi:hypothetical protein
MGGSRVVRRHGSWRAGCVETRTSGSEVRVGETDRPKSRHCAPTRPYSSAEITYSSAASVTPWNWRAYRSSTRAAFRSKSGSRGKIQDRKVQGRMASSASHRQMVDSEMLATMPRLITSSRMSGTNRRDRGTSRAAGSSQAMALTRGVHKRDRGLESEKSARSATMPRHDPVPPLPCPTQDPRLGALRPAFGSRGGARECDPASPRRHPAPASQASRVPDLGQGVPHRREQAAPAGGVALVPGPPRDALLWHRRQGLGRIALRDALPSIPRFASSSSD